MSDFNESEILEKFPDNDFTNLICEAHRVYATCVHPCDIRMAEQVLEHCLLKIPRIPIFIDRLKKYDNFLIEFDEKLSQSLKGNTIILLKDDAMRWSKRFFIFPMDLVLNANYFTHSELLHKILPGSIRISAYEIVGNIVHLNLTDDQIIYKNVIGKIIHWKTNKTVICKKGQIENIYRFYEFDVLAGNNSLETIHSENGVKIFIDLSRVYWCSRLQQERRDLLSKFKASDVICDPFCGAGPHILPSLKKGCKVYANDLNPDAIRCLRISLELNKLVCNTIYNLDAGDFLSNLKSTRIDHCILNLPEFSLNYISYTKYFSDTTIHCYFFCQHNIDPVTHVLSVTGLQVRPEWIRLVRMVSPSKAVLKLEFKNSEVSY